MRPVRKQTVLVCGGSRGIGKAIAKRFGECGANVAIHYKSNHAQAADVARYCQRHGSDVLKIAADVKDRTAVGDMVTAVVKRWGRIDSVIYCSGIAKAGLFQQMTERDYDDVMNTHVRGLFYVLQAASPHMLRQKAGRIVVLSSVWGSTGGANEVLYSAAKGAVNALTKALAKEWAPSGITVNAVAPGAIETDMTGSLDERDKEATVSAIPLDRFGLPEEVAHWVVHLCQPESGYMTGQVLHVNGGWFIP